MGLNQVFSVVGYRLQSVEKIKPIERLSFSGDPRCLRYWENSRSYLIKGKMKDGRGLLLFSLDPDGNHPFVKAVRLALKMEEGDHEKISRIKQALDNFYSTYQPLSAAEVLGMNSKLNPWLSEQPPWVVIKPWEELTIEERKKRFIKSEKNDNHQVTRKKIDVSHGCNFCGPVSPVKLEIESVRLYRILCSVKKNGLVRHDYRDGDIVADVLIHPDGEWSWLIRSGQHRASVLSGCGFNWTPIRVRNIVCRDEAEFWPQVVNGNYTLNAALQVFDNIFSGIGMVKKLQNKINANNSLL